MGSDLQQLSAPPKPNIEVVSSHLLTNTSFLTYKVTYSVIPSTIISIGVARGSD